MDYRQSLVLRGAEEENIEAPGDFEESFPIIFSKQ